MRVIYCRLQQLAAVGLELSGLRRRGNLSALLILRRDILLLRWCILQVMQVVEDVLSHRTEVALDTSIVRNLTRLSAI